MDNGRKCLRELAPSKNAIELKQAIEYIPGSGNVSHTVVDMDDGFKNFALDFFPDAKIVVDKFHVIHFVRPVNKKYRKGVTGDKRSNPIRHLLLKNRNKLETYQKRGESYFVRQALTTSS